MSEDFLINVQHTRGDFQLDVGVALEAGRTLGVFGASGAGKTSLLRCIAGLEQPRSAHIVIGGVEWQTQSMFMPAHERRVGFVFQEPRLFPGSVRYNLDFARRRAARSGTNQDEVIDALDLARFLHRDVMGLSGGEAKRVAIARALLSSPHLLLMDEPTVSLDRASRQELLPYLARLKSMLNVPMLYVSHELDELIQLADQLLVIERGQSLAHGSLQQVVSDASLPGLDGAEAGVVVQGNTLDVAESHGLRRVEFAGGELLVAAKDLPESPRLRIRANDVSVCRSRPSDSSILNLLDASIVAIEDESELSALLRLRIGEQEVLARITQQSRAHLQLAVGDFVVAQIKTIAVRGGPIDVKAG